MNIRFFKPTFKDLVFRQKILKDKATMIYNRAYGWTIDFNRKKWRDWYYKWILKPDKRYYRYVEVDGEFVGDVSYRYDEEYSSYIMSLTIYDKFRNRGYGKNALELLLIEARKNGVKILCDNIAANNGAVHLFLKCGFRVHFKDKNIIFVYKDLRYENC